MHQNTPPVSEADSKRESKQASRLASRPTSSSRRYLNIYDLVSPLDSDVLATLWSSVDGPYSPTNGPWRTENIQSHLKGSPSFRPLLPFVLSSPSLTISVLEALIEQHPQLALAKGTHSEPPGSVSDRIFAGHLVSSHKQFRSPKLRNQQKSEEF